MKALVAIPLAVAVVLTLFAWPSARLEPRDLPIGIAGPAPATQALEKRLSASQSAFDLHRYDDAASARAAIDEREVYGAFVATPAGLTVLTSSAASGAVAQQLTVAGTEAGAVAVKDVRAAPRGAALASSVLPLAIAGILTGAAAALLGKSALSKAGLLLGASLLSGLVAVLIVQGWLDVVEGAWPANAAVLGLTVLAIGATVAGLHAVFGERGAIAGALTMILIGNPFSGVGSAPELLPQPVGAIGQLLPPGAGGNLLRSTGFFDGAAAAGHVAVLTLWALAGLALVFAAAGRVRYPAGAFTDATKPRTSAAGSE